jgi:NitT/TauT family transport system ATP-binding protein
VGRRTTLSSIRAEPLSDSASVPSAVPHLHVVDGDAVTPTAPPRIQLDNVSVRFGTRGASAVEEVSLSIGRGEFVALLGPSGCGKSTLLNVMAGFLPATQGNVRLDGSPLAGPSAQCGVVFQKHSLFPWMSVLDNVAYGPRRLGMPNARRIAEELLDTVGLSHVAKAWPFNLSGGMQQRVGIARALATRPPVLLMDEPFGALDAQTRALMQEELLSIWDKLRPTVVFVTHDIEEAIFLADRVIVMQAFPGRVAREILVPFARPRAPEIMDEAAFIERRREIADIIRVEARKSFR